MLSTKLNVALSVGTVNKTSSNILFGTWNFRKSNNQYYCRIKEICRCKSYSKFNTKFVKHPTRQNFMVGSKHVNISPVSILLRNFASETNFQEKADMFGDLDDKQYEKVILDEDEVKEEEFLKNEAKPNRRFVPSPGKYVQMIKEHIGSGDLEAAMRVLDQIKEDRNKPNNYMFNLLIRAFAVRGDLKKSFSLYNKMKKADLKPTLATFTSLFNACANSPKTAISIEKLNDLRHMLIENDIQLNAAHYNAMIKAYGRHGKLNEAFQLVDTMRDKKLTVGISTLNFLLQGSISDTEAGFRHALVIWQLLKSRKLKPNIYTYNLLLRATKECKLGDFKIEDLLISEDPTKMQTLFESSDRTNLLAHPPKVCLNMPLIEDSKNPELLNGSDDTSESNINSTDLTRGNSPGAELVTMGQNTDNLAPVVKLESSSAQTNLLLLGGFRNFVDQMKMDNIKPDIKTVTYLMELVPPTLAAEKSVINYAKAMGIQLDIDFYNLLIRKRSLRYDYDGALKVMSMIQQDNLEPNIMTWGVLALTCRKASQARELIEGMESSGFTINIPIIGALISQASSRWHFGLVLELMEKIRRENLKPSDRLYEMLESLKKKAIDMSKNKDPPDFVKTSQWQNGFRKFNLRYPTWLKEIQELPEKNKERNYRKNKSP